MKIRAYVPADFDELLELVVEAFRPYYEGFVRPLMGEMVFQHQHGDWIGDYRQELPSLDDPPSGRHMVVGTVDSRILGCIAWSEDLATRHGTIYLMAVRDEDRGHQYGRALCEFAIERLREVEVEVVGIGTGDDAFHAAARTLYEALGFTKIPTAGYLRQI